MYIGLIINQLLEMKNLEELIMSDCVMVTSDVVKDLCGEYGPPKLNKVDFRMDRRWVTLDTNTAFRVRDTRATVLKLAYQC